MSISEKTIKLLWAEATGRCSFKECNTKLTGVGSEPYTLGEMAHIKGAKKGSNRYDPTQSNLERNSYENLILLCPNHHTQIDKPENETIYTVEILLNMKKEHEQRLFEKLREEDFKNIDDVKSKIAILLAENYQAWFQYGPLSEKARRNPHNLEIYEIWKYQRLSVIVPNNRLIANLLERYRSMFSLNNQSIISEFLIHFQSYEQWVHDDISYQSVTPFPENFKNIILGN